MVVYLKPSLGLIQDGDAGFPQGEWLLGAIPKLPWVAKSMFSGGRIWGPDPSKGQDLVGTGNSVGG